MAALAQAISRFRRDERAATAIEYGLIAALIAVAVIIAMTAAGGGLVSLFGGVRDRTIEVIDGADV